MWCRELSTAKAKKLARSLSCKFPAAARARLRASARLRVFSGRFGPVSLPAHAVTVTSNGKYQPLQLSKDVSGSFFWAPSSKSKTGMEGGGGHVRCSTVYQRLQTIGEWCLWTVHAGPSEQHLSGGKNSKVCYPGNLTVRGACAWLGVNSPKLSTNFTCLLRPPQTCTTLSSRRPCATSSTFRARPRFAWVSCWGGCLRWWAAAPQKRFWRLGSIRRISFQSSVYYKVRGLWVNNICIDGLL